MSVCFIKFDLVKYVSCLFRTVSSVVLLSPQSILSPASTSTSELEHEQEKDKEVLQPTSSAKQKKPNEKDIQKVLLDALATEPPKMDGTDGFLLKLGESLRRLPYREKCKLEIDILNLVYERELQLHL
ncbi:hypothetical protein RI129_002933 [Pyrocoelia pectoralis]|uniref:BESS domain-containing protein n=1 Tax=Pyrocoelia pectoralis TaxID=417401 RepID=A0AAN7VMV1_9COLE